MTTKKVAMMLQVSQQRLRADRSAGRGLPFKKFDRVVMYRREDIQRYLASITIRPAAR